MDDKRIIDLLFQRNELGLEELKSKYGEYCFSIALNALGSIDDAEECLNDTLFAVWTRIPPDNPNDLRSFVGRIVRNLSVGRYRNKTSKKRGGGELPVLLDELRQITDKRGIKEVRNYCGPVIPSPESEVLSKELDAAVNAFLKTIPPRDCDIFLCRYYYFISIGDIALRFGLSRSNVSMILTRTRRKLADHLKKEGLL